METSSNKNASLSTFDWFFTVLVGSLSLALYIRTLAPGVLPSDSGEFQVLAHQLGIAHCPGYPVYIVMAKLFTYLPIGGIAFRVNLFSAFMAALTVSGVYLACRILSLNRWAATFGALILAISYTFWSQAVIAEVYTAGAALAIFILVLVLRWGQTGKKSLLFFAGLLGGLSLGVHMTTVLLAPGILVYLWLHRKENPGLWRVAVGGVLIGVVIFLVIFILLDWNYPSANIFNAAYDTARSDWGLSEDDIKNPWVRIWFVASSQQWRSALDFNWLDMVKQGASYYLLLPREFSTITLVLMVLGLGYLSVKRWDIAALFWLSLITYWLISFNYRIWDIYVFYITSYVMLVILAAVGLDVIGNYSRKIFPRFGFALQAGISLLIILISVSSVLAPRWDAVMEGVVPFIGEEGYLLWEDPNSTLDVIKMTVAEMEPDSVFFMEWTWLYPYYYAAHIDQGRTDLRFIEAAPRSDTPGLPHSVLDFINENIDSRPIYFSTPLEEVKQGGYKFKQRQIRFSTFYEVIRP